MEAAPVIEEAHVTTIHQFGTKLGQEAGRIVESELDALQQAGVSLRVEDLEGLRERILADVMAITAAEARVRSVGRSPIAERIGPVYRGKELCRWLPAPGRPALTDEAIRKRVKHRRLIGFLTDDRVWVFPAWQFARIAGQLVALHPVIELWNQLPTQGFLTDADLAAWMSTRLRTLDGTPAEHAARHGADDPPLQQAASRLRARAA